MHAGPDATLRSSRKVDARLGLFLALKGDRLTRLVRDEELRIRELERARVDARRRSGSEADLPIAAPITAGLHVRDGRVVASVFVLSDAGSDDLRALGALVRSQAGDLFTATVPLDAMERLLASPAIRFVELGRPHFRDAGNPAIAGSGLANLHAAVPPVRGSGVIAGVLDRGMDFYHPDFRDASGATRILYLWDQELTPVAGEASPPASLFASGSTTYGVEYAKSAIDAALAAFVPGTGNAYALVRHKAGPASHGTHVAGILAGNGSADPKYTGAAPEADLVFVHYPILFNPAVLADSTYVADGFAYIFARAAALGRPAVVNLSVSDDQSAHDGTTLGERFIERLLALPGRAVSASAGNANGLAQHATGTVTAGASTVVGLVYPATASNSDAIEIWYHGQDRFTVTVAVPGTSTIVIGPLAAGAGIAAVTVAQGVDVAVTSTVDDPRNHENVISIVIMVQPGSSVPAGTWLFTLTGVTVVDGRFDAWVDRNNRTAAGRAQWQAPWVKENALTLGVPSTCRSVITVGNLAAPGPAALHLSSGRGFSRDGRVKPDLAALGTTVEAPSSRDMNVSPGAPAYRTDTGTSQAAPLVGGACALLFQCRGASATWSDLAQVLADSADRTNLSVPDPGYGFGRLSVAAACAVPVPTVDVWLRDDASDTGIEPFVGPVSWLSPDIELLDLAQSPATNPVHDPAQRYGNLVRVTVRNRGTNAAHNTGVFLYWADPSTNIAYPADWNATGFFVGSPAFATSGNVVNVPSIPAGGSAQVVFAWAPPAAGGNLAGDAHYCLLARVENANDGSPIGQGGWSAVAARNNIALHNLDVVNALPGGDSVSEFAITGGAGANALEIESQLDREVIVELPAVVLPWRDASAIEAFEAEAGSRSLEEGWATRIERIVRGPSIRDLTDVVGAIAVELGHGKARIRLGAHARAMIPTLRLAAGARAQARVIVEPGTGGRIHIGQLCGGRRVGGVTVEADPVRGRRARRP